MQKSEETKTEPVDAVLDRKEKCPPDRFQVDQETLDRIAAVLKRNKISVFEFDRKAQQIFFYDESLKSGKLVLDFPKQLELNQSIYADDKWKVRAFLQGSLRGPIELRFAEENGETSRKMLDAVPPADGNWQPDRLLGTITDVTAEKQKAQILEDQARKDSLTGLYNQLFGKELINRYLQQKSPYDSCGLMVIDIDYFKNVNDTYGHLFGDRVLIELAQLLLMLFDKKDIIMRAGGDEFVVLLKDISHSVLIKKAGQLVEGVRSLVFPENDYSMTCSVGVCFLPENVSGYTYDQLFSNADWALYRAKESGRNRYVFCDNLQQFEMVGSGMTGNHPSIDARYLHNDIVATAFEIFEKTNSFDAAIRLLMEVIGIRFQLDRITIVQTNIHEKNAGRQYQWTSENAPEVLQTPGSFTKEDFLTLFRSYDEFGTTVLQYDSLSMYSEDAAALLMQGEAKTVLYAAMYCEGKYTGAVSYVDCKNKRFWSRQSRSQMGELTKIISAHLAKKQAMNSYHSGTLAMAEYDSLTGLLSFEKFRENLERTIVGGYATSHLVVYSDFENFKYFNQKCGYQMGDRLLKEYSNYMIERLAGEKEIYFTRVVADQFILFMPSSDVHDTAVSIEEANASFVRQQMQRYQDVHFRIRTGIYRIPAGCDSASAAIDAANYARRQVSGSSTLSVRIYDEELDRKRVMEIKILNNFDIALKKGEFQIFLQPKFSLPDLTVIGAEAVARWKGADGTVLEPGVFLPFFEKNRRILELDYYVFEQVAAFLAKNRRQGRPQVPISVNASILHAQDSNTEKKYMEILQRYGVDPSLLEIELAETATVSYYDNVRKLFQRLQDVRLMTTLDDFGAGYSVLNTVIDIPVNTVKIDRVLVQKCESSEKGKYFMKQMISMVKGLGYRVVCEGVETEEQVELLKDAGCEEAQGYWLAKPLSLEEYEAMVYVAQDGRLACRPEAGKRGKS